MHAARSRIRFTSRMLVLHGDVTRCNFNLRFTTRDGSPLRALDTTERNARLELPDNPSHEASTSYRLVLTVTGHFFPNQSIYHFHKTIYIAETRPKFTHAHSKPGFTVKGWTPALSAASANHREVMMLLHRSGADLKMKDMTGSTVAHMAASTNSVQSLMAIYDCFGDPGVLSTQANNGSTPAHIAAIFDNAEVSGVWHLGWGVYGGGTTACEWARGYRDVSQMRGEMSIMSFHFIRASCVCRAVYFCCLSACLAGGGALRVGFVPEALIIHVERCPFSLSSFHRQALKALHELGANIDKRDRMVRLRTPMGDPTAGAWRRTLRLATYLVCIFCRG